MNDHRRDVSEPPDHLSYHPDPTSLAEYNALATQIDLEEKTNKHRRTEQFRDLFSRGIQGVIVLAISVAVVTLLVVAWHHQTPANWHWLTDKQLADLRTFIFSGAVVKRGDESYSTAHVSIVGFLCRHSEYV